MFPLLFERDVPHGRLVGVRLPAEDEDLLERSMPDGLDVEEWDYAARLTPLRRRTWIGGRIALRRALAALSIDAGPLLATPRGAPLLPPGIAGSVSHKETLAVALVARDDEATRGVDVELDTRRPTGIARRVLTDDELAAVEQLPQAEQAAEVLLRFSAKEAIYKALDPFVRRYVGFREARVIPLPDGTAQASLTLPEAEGHFSVDVRWMRWTDPEPLVLTTARIARVPRDGIEPPTRGFSVRCSTN